MYLSIVVPFFNSEKKSIRLLDTLSSIEDVGIEIVLIDDGSQDNTYSLLQNFKRDNLNKNVELIKQHNKGPGGARNAGTKIAKGKYVWFVDSDDDITSEGLAFIRENHKKDFDFIDFNVCAKDKIINSMSLSAGEYIGKNKCHVLLLKDFGRISSKVFMRELIINKEIFYPEYCIYEDNPLIFVYPHFITSFLKTDIAGYIHHEEYESVTRTKSGTRFIAGARFLDRLHTVAYGFKKGSQLTDNQEYIDIMKQHFIELYFTNTIGMLVSFYPNSNWLTMIKVMKQYRKVSKELKVYDNPFDYIGGSTKFRFYLKSSWALSYLIFKDQTDFFNAKRKEAWGENA